MSYDVKVIHGVCEGADLFSLQHLLIENLTYCNFIQTNSTNEIVINCNGEKLDPEVDMGIFITDCSGNCTDSIYIIGEFY